MLYTVDPFGHDRIPKILDGWHLELRDHVRFSPVYSMQLFQDLIERKVRPDFIFIDGNHDYEFALFDLFASARCVRLGGVIFCDNYCDPGVARAVREFERANPEWRAVRFNSHRAFGTNFDQSVLGGLYRVLVAPSSIHIGSECVTFLSGRFAASGVAGFRVNLAAPAVSGRLFYKIYLRAVPLEFHLGRGELIETSMSGAAAVEAGMSVVPIRLAGDLVGPVEGFYRRYELALVFEADEGNRKLALNAEPEPQWANMPAPERDD